MTQPVPSTSQSVGGIPHWEDSPDTWDQLVLDDIVWPGVATLKITRGKKVDQKSAKGKQKARITLQGYDAATIDITIQVETREEVAALATILPNFEPVPDKTAATEDDAFDIVHPVAAFRGVRSIIIVKITGPELKNHILTLSLECLEFSKTSNADATTTPDGSAANAAKPPTKTPFISQNDPVTTDSGPDT